jgi:hypothetical protein
MKDQLQLGADPLKESPTEAQAAAEEGWGKALRARRVQAWKYQAEYWLDDLDAGEEFVSDDLVRDVGLPDIGPNCNNVVGAWFSGQAKRGTIEFVGRMRRSKRVVRHGNPQRVWRKV